MKGFLFHLLAGAICALVASTVYNFLPHPLFPTYGVISTFVTGLIAYFIFGVANGWFWKRMGLTPAATFAIEFFILSEILQVIFNIQKILITMGAGALTGVIFVSINLFRGRRQMNKAFAKGG
jgi:hypothetical protein